MKKIALFGTSADPPTAGHQAILSWLSQHFDLVVVWAADNPLKTHQSPLPHRFAMLQLLIADLDLPRSNIGLYPELSRPRTLETINLARMRWSKAVFSLVIGSDLVPQLPRWYRIRELFEQVEILVVPRPGYPIEDTSLENLRQLGATFAIADLSAPAVSSTAYRQQKDPEALTPNVKAYIHREQLYACQDATPR